MVDVLYIHPMGANPSFASKYYKKVKNNASHNFGFIPMGIIGIVNNLISNGISVAGVNLPLKGRVNPNFDLASCLEHYKPKVVLIDMHWYVHIRDGLKIAKECSCKVIVGGMSATLFYKQLISHVDYVVKGDAEKPILELVKGILDNSDVSSVENVACSSFDNPVTYHCSDIDNYDYVNIDFLEDKESYLNMFDFWLLVGKGCPFNCEKCDGARHSTSGIFGRDRTIFRKPSRIVDDVKAVTTETINFNLDVSILPTEVIDALAKERFKMNLRNEFFQLADVGKFKRIITSFLTFDLVFSPVSGDDKERREYGKKFTNEQFLSMLKEFEEADLNGGVIVYFTDYMISPKSVKKLDERSRKQLISMIEEVVDYSLIEVMPQIVDPGTLKDEFSEEELFRLYSS